MRVCWDRRLDAHGVVINLLVCRLERKIDVNKSTRALFRMLQPKLLKIAKRMVTTIGNSGHASIPDLVAEMQSVAVESLMTQYVMGEALHPLRWLFGDPHGAITRWSIRHTNNIRRQSQVFYSYGHIAGDGPAPPEDATNFDLEDRLTRLNFTASGSAVRTLPEHLVHRPEEYDDHAESRDRNKKALDIVDDGVTFPLSEYRVLRFCLTNANDAASVPTAGLHQHLSKTMRSSRKSVTRLYGLAQRRLLDASGQTASHLRARGLRIPSSAKHRRRNWRMFTPQPESLSAAEVCELIELRSRGVSNMDLAWIFGVSEDFVYRIRRRFTGMSKEQIQERCSR
jgi:hypothetical protein